MYETTKLPAYICHKTVKAAPIARADTENRTVRIEISNEFISVTVPDNFFAHGIPACGDYLVAYEDGYLSWSPKAVFEDGYDPATSRMDFGGALRCLGDGMRVARAGWNGKGMWLTLVTPKSYDVSLGTVGGFKECYGLLPWIGMRTADNRFVPWLASQTDMLATDWEVISP